MLTSSQTYKCHTFFIVLECLRVDFSVCFIVEYFSVTVQIYEAAALLSVINKTLNVNILNENRWKVL